MISLPHMPARRSPAELKPDADAALTGGAEALVIHRGGLDTGIDADIALRPPLQADIHNTAKGLALAGRSEGVTFVTLVPTEPELVVVALPVDVTVVMLVPTEPELVAVALPFVVTVVMLVPTGPELVVVASPLIVAVVMLLATEPELVVVALPLIVDERMLPATEPELVVVALPLIVDVWMLPPTEPELELVALPLIVDARMPPGMLPELVQVTSLPGVTHCCASAGECRRRDCPRPAPRKSGWSRGATSHVHPLLQCPRSPFAPPRRPKCKKVFIRRN
jgi:hypothetical protein